MEKGLFITVFELHKASGIDEQIIRSDIQSSFLRSKEDKIWYRDALKYSEAKWSEGKVNMFPQTEFAERLLDILDDNISEEWINAKKK